MYSLRKNHIPNADIYIATAIRTSVYLNSYKDVPNGSKLYFIQGYECWGDVTQAELYKTYHFPFQKIAVSNWLKKKIEETESKDTVDTTENKGGVLSNPIEPGNTEGAEDGAEKVKGTI